MVTFEFLNSYPMKFNILTPTGRDKIIGNRIVELGKLMFLPSSNLTMRFSHRYQNFRAWKFLPFEIILGETFLNKKKNWVFVLEKEW